MKLNSEQKVTRKENLKRLSEQGGILATDGVTTVVWWPAFKGAKTGEIAFSTCNPKDKFRRKFGEFQAFENLCESRGVVVRREIAEMLADIFQSYL